MQYMTNMGAMVRANNLGKYNLNFKLYANETH